jgi:hypothetical protein
MINIKDVDNQASSNDVVSSLSDQEVTFCHHYVNNGFKLQESLDYAGIESGRQHVFTQRVAQYVKELVQERRYAIQKIINEGETKFRISFEWVSDELRKIVDSASTRDKLRAISEINKMYGYYSPEKTVNVHASIKDTDLEEVKGLTRFLFEKNKSEF